VAGGRYRDQVRFELEMRTAGGNGPPPATVSYRPRRMSRIIAAMLALRMTVDGGPPPKFPLWAVYGVSDFDSAGRPLGGRAADYQAELATILSWHGHTDEVGIPVHKLRTNLGWHVTAAECAAAVLRYDEWSARGEPSPAVFGDHLIPFLRAAATADGFEVH
jgi:hypothetical protein